jgi:hypothetical protein
MRGSRQRARSVRAVRQPNRPGLVLERRIARFREQLEDLEDDRPSARRPWHGEDAAAEDSCLERRGCTDLVGSEVIRVLGQELGDRGRAGVANAFEDRSELLRDDAGGIAVDAPASFIAEQDRREDPVEERPRLVARDSVASEADRRSPGTATDPSPT